jgi:hypothetical protein
MRKKYVVLAVCFTLLSCGVAWAFYLYNKSHGNVGSLHPAFRVDATELYGEYRRDEAVANRKFVDKVIELRGIISNQELTDSTMSVLLDTGDPAAAINCSFLLVGHKKISLPPKGASVTIKGRCAGFLNDVNVVDCVME